MAQRHRRSHLLLSPTSSSSTRTSGSDQGSPRPSYPVMQLTDFRMGLHTDQQTLIFQEFMSTRRKLEEDNQRLREELEHARFSIRILKTKLDKSQGRAKMKKKQCSGRPDDVTVEEESANKHWQSLPFSRGKVNGQHRPLTPSRKDTFRNLFVPGQKTFHVATKCNRLDTIQETASRCSQSQDDESAKAAPRRLTRVVSLLRRKHAKKDGTQTA
jgi:hypothetical protein